MLSFLKSRDFPIQFMAMWWVLWLVIAQTRLSDFTPPSSAAVAQFAALVLSFWAGYQTVKHRRVLGFGSTSRLVNSLNVDSTRMRFALRASALLCLAMLLVSLHLSGALSTEFIDYFAKLRLNEEEVGSLTGIRPLDVLTKILAFPLSYTVILVVLASDSPRFRFTLFVCVANLLAFSYLWQVNYPLIHLFWFLVFHFLLRAHRRGALDMRMMLTLLVVFAVLLASAVNRFGDLLGGLQRYIVGYHLVGFSFYDVQYQNPHSILHDHSLGRSSLGFLDQMLEAASKVVGLGYKAASFENSTNNNEAVDIGLREVREFNAFGTLLFSLYRDFHIVGVVVGGFLYGTLTTHALHRSESSWLATALFMVLASSWMVGMMVNPLEQAYFWFAVVALACFSLVNRGIRI